MNQALITDPTKIKDDADFKKSISSIKKAEKVIADFKITNPEQEIEGLNMIKRIKILIKERESKRKTFVDPLNGVIKLFNAEFKPGTDKLKELEITMKDEVLAYQGEGL